MIHINSEYLLGAVVTAIEITESRLKPLVMIQSEYCATIMLTLENFPWTYDHPITVDNLTTPSELLRMVNEAEAASKVWLDKKEYESAFVGRL